MQLVAKVKGDYRLLINVIKFQALIRGHLARKQMRYMREEQLSDMFNGGDLEINEMAYNHPRVYEIVDKLGQF